MLPKVRTGAHDASVRLARGPALRERVTVNLPRKILYGSLFFLLILLLGGLAAFFTTRRMKETDAAIRHTDAVLHTLDHALRQVSDIESGVHGYVLTGSELFLDRYRSGRDGLPSTLGEVQILAADNPFQQGRLAELEPLVAARVAIAEAQIAVRRKRGLAAAAAVVSEGRSKAASDRIRDVIAAMKDEELRLLAERVQAAQDATVTAYRVLGIVFAGMMVLVGASSILLATSVTRRSRELLAGLDRMAGGDLSVQLEPGAADELGQVMATFNRTVRQRREAMEELARFHALLDALLQAAPGAVIAVNVDDEIDFWNPAAARLFGYTADEVLGKPVESFFITDATRYAELRERTVVRREVSLSREYSLRRRDGTPFDAAVSTAPLMRGGHAMGLMAVAEDITVRKREIDKLRESEERFRLALEEAPIGMAIVGLDGRFIRVNSRLCEIVGYTPDELADLTFQAITHPGDIGTDLALSQRLARGEIPRYQLYKRYIRKSGSVVDVLLSASLMRSHGGVPLYFIAQVEDVTEQKRSEERMRVVLDLAPVGIVLGTREGRLEANRRAGILFGRKIDASFDVASCGEMFCDASGKPLPPDDVPCVRALYGARIEARELRLRRADGQVIPVVVSAAPIPGAAPNTPAAVMTIEDITNLKDLERLRMEWSSLVVHDLRQPLNTITLSADLLARQVIGQPQLHKRAEQIRELALRLGRMIQELLDFSRLEARQLSLRLQAIDAVALVKEAADRFALGVSDRPLRTHLGVAQGIVAADSDRLAQIMENLLSNAVKYGDPGTPIDIEVSADDDTATVSVTNEGPGIAPDEMPGLFSRFRRLTEARRSDVEGTGLGLYITRALVEAHGGRIEAESVAGRTTFRFTLPLAHASV